MDGAGDPGRAGAILGLLLQRVILNRVVGSDPLPSLIATFGLSVAMQNADAADLVRRHTARSVAATSTQPPSARAAAVRGRVADHRARHRDGARPAASTRCCASAASAARLRAAAADVERGGDDRRQPEERLCGRDGGGGVPSSALPRSSSRCGRPSLPPTARSQLIYAFEAVIIGGMGSIWGAFLGAMVLGVEPVHRIPHRSRLRHPRRASGFLIVLALRPQGLLGKDLRL